MIDWAHLYGLRADIGSDAFAEVIALFLEEADGTMERLGQPDADVTLLLHMLKGTALAVGCTELASNCLDGERRAGAGAVPDVGATAAAYQRCRDALLSALEQVRLASGTPAARPEGKAC